MNKEKNFIKKCIKDLKCKKCNHIYSYYDCDRSIEFPFCPKCGALPTGTVIKKVTKDKTEIIAE